MKISSDMPLPMPRSVMSSPIHMMRPVPAVIVTTMSRIAAGESLVMSCEHSATLPPPVENSAPLRATVMRVVDCSTPSAMVRYRVYWVRRDWPAWPSLYRVSKCGMTTRSSCTMIDAVMYGMIPSAKTLSLSSAPPLNRLMRS